MTRYYPEIPCPEVYKEEEVSKQLWNQTNMMLCPDLGNNTINLQGGDHNMDVVSDQTFFFVIDSCEHFSNRTKQKDCKTQAETDEIISRLVIEIKLITEFFSVKTYLGNDMKMQHEIARHRMQLSPISYDRRTYTISQTKVTLKNNYSYNFASAGGIKEVYYDASYTMGNLFLPTQRDMTTKSPYDSPLSIQFIQS